MDTLRSPVLQFPSQPTLEGAGVHLRRAVGHDRGLVERFDPFLLLDDIHSANPDDYVPGFPWHPHRGIETVTYVLQGQIDHGDSLGNRGTIGSGDVQWMTAGSGILHQEMPQRYTGDFRGLQLWVNLPARHKWIEPQYRDLPEAAIPCCRLDGGAAVKVIAGRCNGCQGPLTGLLGDPEFLDVSVPAGTGFSHPTPEQHTVFAYVLEGAARFARDAYGPVTADHVVLFGPGDSVTVTPGPDGVRLLLFCGAPLGEPVAWRGPIVMNTQEELDQAFREVRDGTFIRSSQRP